MIFVSSFWGTVQSLRREDSIADFIKADALRRDANKGLFYVKDSLIPLKFFAIRNLLLSLGLFERDSTLASGNLLVNANATELFETLVVNSLTEQARRQRRRISLSELKNRIDQQEELGENAEIFVLAFEQQRLKNHSSAERIRRVSKDYANAGFDIESFNDNESVFLDRCIEVKSYSENVVFHWSQNEIETAKEFAEKYFLYLVDRNEMLQPGYTPRIFQNPYHKIFENEFWKKDAEGWKISPL